MEGGGSSGSAPSVEDAIESDGRRSFGSGVTGFVMIAVGGLISISPSVQAFPWLSAAGFGAQLAGTAMLVVGLGLYARKKGRSVLWGGLGLASWIGALILGRMSKSCRQCGASAHRATVRCEVCGGSV